MQQSLINRIFKPKVLVLVGLVILVLLFFGIRLSQRSADVQDESISPTSSPAIESYFDIRSDQLPEFDPQRQLTASQSAQVTWQFLFTDHQFEPQLPVYKWVTKQLSLDEAREIANKLNLTNGPIQDGELLYWSSNDDQQQLNIQLNQGNWTYQDFSQKFPEGFTEANKMFVTEEEVKKITTDFLFTHTFFDYLLTTYQPIKCFGGQHHPFLITDITLAEKCLVSLSRELNGYLVYNQDGTNSGGIAEVSQFQKVQKMTLSYPQVQQSNQQIALNTLESAKNQIKVGNGQLILNNPELKISNQSVIKLTKVSLGYLDMEVNNYLIPAWVFEGIVVERDLTSQIMILLPAINKQLTN